MTQVATLVYALGILGLFWLNKDKTVQTSRALWLPAVWLLINGSRPVSVWLHLNSVNSSDLYLEGSPFDRNIYLMLVAAGVAVLFRRQAAVQRFLRANPAVITFFLYCAVSCLWADNPDVAFKRWIKACGDVVMVLITLTERDRLASVRRLLARVGFILIPVSILLIKYYPDMARYYSRWEGRMFVSGVAEDKNMLGMLCLVFGLGAWWRFLGACQDYQGRQRLKVLCAQGALLAMVGWLFWMANSMTSISCFIMTSLVIAMTRLFRFARKPGVTHLLVATVVIASFSVLFLKIGGGALEAMGRNSTLTGRTDIWQGLLHVGSNPVIGTGFQSFWVGENLKRVWDMGGLFGGINESHNGYLETYLNLGAIGVLLLLGLLITGYSNLIKRVRRDTELAVLGLGFFATAVIYAFTEASAFGIMNPVWFAFLIAVIHMPGHEAAPARFQRLDRPAVAGAWQEGVEGSRKEAWWAGQPR